MIPDNLSQKNSLDSSNNIMEEFAGFLDFTPENTTLSEQVEHKDTIFTL
jgi:hypothetical protein